MNTLPIYYIYNKIHRALRDSIPNETDHDSMAAIENIRLA